LTLQIAPWVLLSGGLSQNEQIKYSAWEAHLGVDELSLQVAILKTKHLVEKLSKQQRVGKLIHY
jgi:hypothetical protein